jgi:Transposase
MDRVEHGWIGIDAGKGHHHVVLIDQEGRTLLSSRVANDEPDLIALVQKIRDHIRHPRWRAR